MKKFLIMALGIAIICTLCIPAAIAAAPPGQANGLLMDPLKIDSGYISGTVIGDPDNIVHIYRGIPYAAPPMGNLRWQPPQAVEPWSGIRECTKFSLVPPQDPDAKTPFGPMPASEDSLYLNVQTPAKTHSEKLPVLVYFHGGGFDAGSGNEPHFNAPGLPQHGVVLVPVNTRLNVMGLMAHPDLTAESPEDASGNYMVLDEIAALKWVKRNIAEFGGDPNNITIAGQSGGGGKVMDLMASPLAKGLFKQAIVESGSMYMDTDGMSLENAEALGSLFFSNYLHVSSLAEARALSWEDIEYAYKAYKADKNPAFKTTVDGWVMPDTPGNIIRAGEHNAVPLIVLNCFGEVKKQSNGVYASNTYFPSEIDTNVELLAGNNKAGAKSYAANFNLVPTGWRELNAECGHCGDQPYIFGILDLPGTWKWRLGLSFGTTANAPPEVQADPDNPGVTDADRQDAEEVMTVIAQFMKTGDPSVKKLITWPAWNADADQYLYFNYPIAVHSGYSQIAQP